MRFRHARPGRSSHAEYTHRLEPLQHSPPATLTYGRPYRAVAVDGHAVNNLDRESKDGKGHLVQPSALARDECYTVALDLLLHGMVAFLIVDGASGRAALVAYILTHGGLASPLSQHAMRHLGLRLCLETQLSATNGGSIFLLYIHGYMTIIFLRPSIGSYAFLEYRRNGNHGMVSRAASLTPPKARRNPPAPARPPCPALRPPPPLPCPDPCHSRRPAWPAASQLAAMSVVHNQMVLLGWLMGIYLETFIHDESPLPLLFETAYQEQITDDLHQLGYLAPGAIYRTPMSNGGHAGGKASAAVAGKFSEKLGRNRATAEEKGHASAALAGTYSEKLGRNRAIAGEGLTDTLLIFSHRPSTELDWGAWMGTRYLRLQGGLDGISRTMLASGAC